MSVSWIFIKFPARKDVYSYCLKKSNCIVVFYHHNTISSFPTLYQVNTEGPADLWLLSRAYVTTTALHFPRPAPFDVRTCLFFISAPTGHTLELPSRATLLMWTQVISEKFKTIIMLNYLYIFCLNTNKLFFIYC